MRNGFDAQLCGIARVGNGQAVKRRWSGLDGALRMPSNVELRHLEVLSARSAIATFVAWHQLQVEGIHVKMQRSWLAPGCRHGRWQTQQDGGAACAALARARERGVNK